MGPAARVPAAGPRLLTDPVERALLDEVLAAPRDDDGPRLAYADHLIARGDPRGEFIVVQCTRERLQRAGDRTSEAYRRARTRERMLLRAHVEAWLEAFGSWRTFDGTLARGFLAEVGAAMPRLRNRWPLLCRHPIEQLAVWKRTPKYAARGGTRPRSMGDVTHGDLQWLASQPAAHALSTLRLHSAVGTLYLDAPLALATPDTHPPDEPVWTGARVIPPWLAEATSGIRVHDGVTATLAELLAAASHPLRVIHDGRYITADDARALVTMPAAHAVEQLCVIGGSADACAALANARFERLRDLTLLFYPPADPTEALRALLPVEALHITAPSTATGRVLAGARLRSLTTTNPADPHGLFDGPLVEHLHELHLSSIDHRTVAALAAAPFTCLAVLELSGCDDAGAIALAKSLALATLGELGLRGGKITDAGARALVESPFLDGLDSIDLRDNALSPETADAVRRRWPIAHV